MKLLIPTTLVTMAMGLMLVAAPAFANQGAERTAVADAEQSAERQARAEIESLLSRLCPGRCELVDIDITSAEPRAVGGTRPGFEGAGGPSQYDTDIDRIEATIMMDSGLPENFQANIPRMAQFRLQNLADDIVVRPELLEFPSPQLPPSPEGRPETPPEPPEQQPEPEPIEEPPDDEPEEEAADEPDEQAEADEPFWQQALPWIALLMTLLILGGLIILILRRLEALASADDDRQPARDDRDDEQTSAVMPDAEALRDDISQSRTALNQMLRDWIDDDPKQVAVLVRLVGSKILSDLRRDPEMRPQLETVSQHVAELDDRIDAEQAQSVARKARSRYEARMVVDDGATDADWDFLEGLTLGQIAKLLDNTSRRERGFVLTRLSPVIRSRYLENLDGDDRRELLLETSSSESLSKSESRKLAARLREVADEFTDAARQADGQAAMITEMLDAMTLGEQQDVLVDMSHNRPDVAHAVLSRMCLESAVLEVPDDMLADTVHRLGVETLTTFLQGTRDDITQRILDAAPASKRQAISTELSLDIPSSRADFLNARSEFSDAIIATLRRNGYDVADFNSTALQGDNHHSQHSEMVQ